MTVLSHVRPLYLWGAALLGIALIVSQVHPGQSLAAIPPQWDDRQTSQDELLSNAVFVLGPQAQRFDLEGYLREMGSPLLEDAGLIESWCAYASVNPQVVLALLETNGRQVSVGWQEALTPEQRGEQVSRLVLDLAQRFYEHLYASGERASDVRAPVSLYLPDGTTLHLAPTASSGTFAVLQTLARDRSAEQFALASDAQSSSGFAATWETLFPGSDRLDASVSITPDAVPPADLLQFPFPVGHKWWFNGAHNWNGSGSTYGKPYSSMDFFTQANNCSAPPASDWAVAAASGKGYHPNGASCWYRIDHASGWSTSYYHLRNMIPNGQVTANGQLGTVACETCVGGYASGPHVHFSLLYNGAYVDLEGVKLSGWTVRSGRGDYNSGSLERNGVTLKPYASVVNEGIKPPGVTATPTATAAPSQTATPTPTPSSTATPSPTPPFQPSAQYLYPKAKDLVRTCPVVLTADADVPAGGSLVFLVRQGNSIVEAGRDADGADGWQIQWDCQDAPDGAATLALSVLDANGAELLPETGQTAVTVSKQCGPGTYRTAFFANTTLSGSPTSSWCKASGINYNWGAQSPGAGVPGGDNFSARFRGNWQFVRGAHRFKVTADDGVRVWVDRVLVVDEWRDQAPTTYTFTRDLTAGLHEIWVDYYERGGSATAVLTWARTYGGAGGGEYAVWLPLVIQ